MWWSIDRNIQSRGLRLGRVMSSLPRQVLRAERRTQHEAWSQSHTLTKNLFFSTRFVLITYILPSLLQHHSLTSSSDSSPFVVIWGEMWTTSFQWAQLMMCACRLISISAGQTWLCFGSAAAVVLNGDPAWSSCHVWEAVTDLWFLCLCLGWPALSNQPHVWALCAAFELVFPWCDLCFCVEGRLTLQPAGCLQPPWLHVTCVQLLAPNHLLMQLSKHRGEEAKKRGPDFCS